MPERAFLTDTWDDDWFQRLSRDQRYLFIYLGTNNHCNQAGAYYITLATMSFETKFSVEELPDILKSLSPRVEWYQEQNYVWVRGFIKQQAKSPKFLIAAAKCLKNIKSNGLAKEIISYNLKEHSISIPYEYDSDSVSVGYGYPTDTSLIPDTDTGSKTGSGTETEKDEISLFGSFSLLRTRLQKAASGSIDRLVEHEQIKQELGQLGREKGLEARSEWQTTSGRVDVCWLNSEGKLVAAFEIDIFEPRSKSLSKLSSLGCQFRCVILRTGKAVHSIEQGIHLIGLDLEEAGNKKHIPRSRTEAEETLCEGDREVISVWRSVKGFDLSEANARELVARLRTEFADLDILAESKAWSARKLSEPLKRGSKPTSQLWNWMRLARKFAQERSQHEQRKSGSGERGQHTKPAPTYEWRETPDEPNNTG